jgi:hypothetical protein
MQSSETVAKIAGALAKAQAEFKGVQKGGQNTYDKYSYAKLEDYVVAIRPVLAKHGLSLLSSVDEVVALEERKTSNGKSEHAVRVKLVVRVLHESGEWVEAAAWGEGQDRADKAVYKAITGARKYGVAAALGLATTDDPEEDGGDEQPPADPPQRQVAAKPDPMADDKAFRQLVAKAFKSREFTPEQMKCAADGIAKACGVDKLEALPIDKRHKVLHGIANGDADQFKTPSGKAA